MRAAWGRGFRHRLTKWGTVYYDSRHRREVELLEFVYPALFERTRKGVLSDAEMKSVEDTLLADPRAGAVMGNTDGVRKVRAAQEFRGKRGSARVAYLYVPEQATVYFIIAFPKNVQGNLTSEQKKQVRALVAQIRDEDWPRKAISGVARKH